MGRQNKPPPRLPPAPWAWPRRVSLAKGRVLIGQGVKGGGNRVIKWCILVRPILTQDLIGSLHTYPKGNWRGWVVEGLRQNGGLKNDEWRLTAAFFVARLEYEQRGMNSGRIL